MKKLILFFLCFIICMGASAMFTLKITIDDLKILFNVTSKENVDDSIYLYGTSKYNIDKLKIDTDTITFYIDNKIIKYPYNNPDLQKVLKESVLY